MLELATTWAFRMKSNPSLYNAAAVPIHPSPAQIATRSGFFTPSLEDREQSSLAAYAASAPVPGPEAGILATGARFEEANREWMQWRFGSDAE